MKALAYKLIYADKSELRIYAHGEALTYDPKTDRETVISAVNENHIPNLIGLALKPRQNLIDKLQAKIAELEKLK